MNPALEAIRKMRYEFLVRNLDVPTAIEISKALADLIKPDLKLMIRYSEQGVLRGNEIQYMGIILTAPSDYKWEDKENTVTWCQDHACRASLCKTEHYAPNK